MESRRAPIFNPALLFSIRTWWLQPTDQSTSQALTAKFSSVGLIGNMTQPLDTSPFFEYIQTMKALAEVTKDALELPSSQRFTLARILLDISDAPDGFDPSAEEAWEREIGRRIAGIQDGTAEYKTSGEVFSELDRRFPG
ncbi:MAG: addiction module protein [Terrimicrobiaceae bacterium]